MVRRHRATARREPLAVAALRSWHRRIWAEARARRGWTAVLVTSRAAVVRPTSDARSSSDGRNEEAVARYVRAVGRLSLAERRLLGDWCDLLLEPGRRVLSYAVPSRRAIALLRRVARGSHVLEIGAGTGLWAAALAAARVRVVAVDAASRNANNALRYSFTWPDGTASRGLVSRDNGRLFHRVRAADGVHAARRSRASTLLLCWPPGEGDSLAADALAVFRGRFVAFVGELAPCAGHVAAGRVETQTASPAFLALLERDFSKVAELDLPPTPFANDTLSVWRRRNIMGRRASRAESSRLPPQSRRKDSSSKWTQTSSASAALAAHWRAWRLTVDDADRGAQRTS